MEINYSRHKKKQKVLINKAAIILHLVPEHWKKIEWSSTCIKIQINKFQINSTYTHYTANNKSKNTRRYNGFIPGVLLGGGERRDQHLEREGGCRDRAKVKIGLIELDRSAWKYHQIRWFLGLHRILNWPDIRPFFAGYPISDWIVNIEFFF